MAAEQFEHFLPLVTSVRRYEGGIKRFTKPLFPGYVFARIAMDRKARIYQRELLARAIPVTHVASFLRQLEDVRTVVAAGYEVAAVPLLHKGQRVKVLGGPLHGLEGMVDDAANPRGIVVSGDILRQGVLVKVPVEQLKLLH
jgi:transcriptional antiterminator RfaH